MDISHRLVASILVILGGLIAIAPARAADATVVYQLPTPDLTGVSAQTAPGVAGCLAGCASLRIPAGSALPARRQGLLAFRAPVGTTIVSAQLRVRYRTKQTGVSAHVQSQIGGRWIDGQRLRSTGGTTATVTAGRGATAVGITLTADAAVPRRGIKSDVENVVTVQSVQLTVRDVLPPSVAWSGADPATGAWQRGALCGSFSAQDQGLGVDHVEYAIGPATATTAAGGGTRLQPRPSTFDGSVCIDSAQLADGTYGSLLVAVDSGATGNRSAALTGLVRVDNTPPSVVYSPPADPEARLPQAQLAVSDAASGLERVTAAIDGIPAVVRVGVATASITAATPLIDGTHHLTWEAVDVAGNVVSGSELLGVADTTAPVIDDAQPQGVVGPTAIISAHALDTGAGLDPAGWRIAVDGIDMTGAAELGTAGSIALTPVRPWAEGEHAVRVTAVDRSGNRTVRTWSFSLPIPPPPPAPIPPAPAPAAETAAAAGPDVSEPAATAAAESAPRPTITLRAAQRHLRSGAQVVLRGRAAAVAGTRVRIEARVGRRWVLVVSVPIGSAGGFSTPVRLPRAGIYDVRARTGEVRSATVRLTAR